MREIFSLDSQMPFSLDNAPFSFIINQLEGSS